MAFVIDDGYTLSATAEITADKLPEGAKPIPAIAFTYRPALADAMTQYRFSGKAALNGREDMDGMARLIVDHVATWDVQIRNKETKRPEPALISLENVRRLPELSVHEMCRIISRWAPEEQARAEGNSVTA